MNTRMQVNPNIFIMQMEYYQNRINSVEFASYVLIHTGLRIEINKGNQRKIRRSKKSWSPIQNEVKEETTWALTKTNTNFYCMYRQSLN